MDDEPELNQPPPAPPVDTRHTLFPTHRLEAFSDGVFAVVVTLLVLDIKLPDAVLGSDKPTGWVDLSHWLGTNGFRLGSYFLSFFLAGMYWFSHHNVFHYIRRVDRRLLSYNLYFLIFVSLIPFSATLISNAYVNTDPAAPILYSGDLFMAGIFLFLIERHAFGNPQLATPEVTPQIARRLLIRSLSPSFVYLLVIAIDLISGSPTLSYFFFMLIPISQIVGARLFGRPQPTTPPHADDYPEQAKAESEA